MSQAPWLEGSSTRMTSAPKAASSRVDDDGDLDLAPLTEGVHCSTDSGQVIAQTRERFSIELDRLQALQKVSQPAIGSIHCFHHGSQ